MASMNSIWAQKERACLLVRSAVCLVVHFHRERACVEAVASLLSGGVCDRACGIAAAVLSRCRLRGRVARMGY
jgi:hypothetical protein